MACMWDEGDPEDGEDIRQKLFYPDSKTPSEIECVGGRGNDHAVLNPIENKKTNFIETCNYEKICAKCIILRS